MYILLPKEVGLAKNIYVIKVLVIFIDAIFTMP